MVRLIRPWIVALLMCAASPVLAANVAAPATAQSEIATLKAQVVALKDQRELEKRLATLEGKTAAEDRARDNLVKEMTFLGYVISFMGFLITLIALGTGVASYFAAGSRAEKKAEEELTKIRGEFDSNVKATLIEFDVRVAQLNATAAEVLTRADETATNLQMTNEHLAEMARLRATMAAMFTEVDEKMPVIREGARISEELGRSTGAGGDRKEATDAQKQKIIAAVAESAGQTEEQWTVDQYKAAIGKALYADKNWQRGAELAQRLIDRHGTNRDALRFGLESLGWAESGRRQWKEALDAYAALTANYESAGETETTDYCFAKHEQGYVMNELGQSRQAEALNRALLPIRVRVSGTEDLGTLVTRYNLAYAILDQGRAAEAEAMLRDLLPIRERVNGPEVSDTLTTRHELARAILNQSRAAEAEEMLRDLLPIRERVDGPEASETLITRHMLARAILDQGRAAEAEKMLRDLLRIQERVDGPEASGTLVTRYAWADTLLQSGDVEAARAALAAIPDPVTSIDWLPRWDAALAFVRGRVADAIGDMQAANAHLARAAEIYASIYPEDHCDRQKLKAYLANRPAKKGAPDA